MKTIDESEAMREIREIRRRQYEETKDLPSEEQIAYDKRLSDEFERESGVKLRRLMKIRKWIRENFKKRVRQKPGIIYRS